MSGIFTRRVSVFVLGVGICAVLAADAVATGEFNCNTCLGNSRGFRRRSARGTIVQSNDPWVARMRQCVANVAHNQPILWMHLFVNALKIVSNINIFYL